MTNQELLQKMRIDMEMRGFSKYTKRTYETVLNASAWSI